MAERSHVLIVGVSEYELTGFSNLPACTNDADRIYAALQQECFFEAADIRMLKGRVCVTDFCAELDSLLTLDNGTVVLYFSGHGCLSENGDVSLVLSDGTLSASPIVGRCRNAHRTTWLIFDMCHAGAVQFSPKPFDSLNAQAGEGCALFASCSPDMVSYIDQGSSCSAFTNALVEAMGIARCHVGVKNLSDIERALQCLIANRNQRTSNWQQPLLLHSSVGPIMFHDPAYIPYQWNAGELPNTELFEVMQVEPSFADRKRYSCKVLAKSAVDRESLVQGLPELINMLKDYEVYNTELEQRKWEAEQTQVLFIYIAINHTDFVNNLFAYCAVWSSLGKNEKLGRGTWHEEAQCWICEQWSPNWLNEMRRHYEESAVTDEIAIQQAKDSLHKVEICASELFLIGDRWLGGLVSTDEFTKTIEESKDSIDKSLETALQIGYPSEQLRPLENQIIDLAGALKDLPLYFLGKGRIGRSEENLRQCFRITKKRYDDARMKIAEIVESELS